MKKLNTLNFLLTFFLLFSLTACEDAFQYSPYASKVENKNLNEENLTKVKQNTINTDTFSFSVIADSHYYYDNLNEVVDYINRDTGSMFTVHAGDLTESGLLWEYRNTYKIINKLHKPFFVCIGNHDYLSNGSDIFRHYFGDKNFTMNIGRNKFIFFDDVVWESINHQPDFDWLESVVSTAGTDTSVFVFTHIPPWTDQLAGEKEGKFKKIMADHKVKAVFCGHEHNFEMADYYHDGVIYVATGSVYKEHYIVVNIRGNQFSVKSIDF